MRTTIQLGNVTTRLAILDGVPGDPDNPASNAVNLSGNDGILAIAELDTPLMENGRLWAGYWQYSADFERPFDLTVGDGNAGWYIGAERQFELGTRSAAAYLRYGQADENFNPVESFVGLGLVVDAPFRNRPDDQVGVSMALARVGGLYRAALSGSGIGPQSHETVWEITYRAQINEWFALQPDIQLVQNPAASSTLENAWIVGLRVHFAY